MAHTPPPRPRKPSFELVMPAYNEARSLPALIERAMAAFAQSGAPPGTHRLVVVDNGSSDNTQPVLQALSTRFGEHALRLVHVPHNQGYGHGLWAGLSACTAPWVGWTHADEQCDPADALRAFERAQARGPALIKGHRHGRALAQRWFTHSFEALANVALNLRLRELNAQPKVMPRSLLTHFVAPPKDFSFDLYALYKARQHRLPIESIDVRFAPRVHGVSRWASSTARRYKTIGRMVGQIARLHWQEGRLSRPVPRGVDPAE